MTTTIFAKNVKDLAEIMLRDTTEGKTYARYTIESLTEKIYADPQAGKAWRDARLRFNYNTDWNTSEERDQKYAAWESENPEPQNIIFTSWWLDTNQASGTQSGLSTSPQSWEGRLTISGRPGGMSTRGLPRISEH